MVNDHASNVVLTDCGAARVLLGEVAAASSDHVARLATALSDLRATVRDDVWTRRRSQRTLSLTTPTRHLIALAARVAVSYVIDRTVAETIDARDDDGKEPRRRLILEDDRQMILSHAVRRCRMVLLNRKG